MDKIEHLKNILHSGQPLTQNDKVLFALAYSSKKQCSSGEIKSLLVDAGVPEARKWNIGRALIHSKFTINCRGQWELNSKGIQWAKEQGIDNENPLILKTNIKLREVVNKIEQPQAKAFWQEALSCFEGKLYRSAIVMSWLATVHLLYLYVVQNKLNEFNAAAITKNSKWKNANTETDLTRMKESEFLEVLASLSIISKNIKKELVECLDRRNGCGHPNTYIVEDHAVAYHIEVLLNNIVLVSPFNTIMH